MSGDEQRDEIYSSIKAAYQQSSQGKARGALGLDTPRSEALRRLYPDALIATAAPDEVGSAYPSNGSERVAHRAHDICADAARLVAGDRARTHGDKHESFFKIALLWTAYLRAKFPSVDISPHVLPPLAASDVANMMELFKVSRRLCGEFNIDDFVDGAGYAGCAGEIAFKERSSP